MERYALIGFPIGHSLSPALFRAAYPEDGMLYDLIEEPSFENACRKFISDYDAVNVTAPFKEAAFLKADTADTVTQVLRATNLLIKRRDDGRIAAYNTDFWAVNNLLRLYREPGATRKVAVVGCGGAGMAAAYAATNLNLDTTVINRNIAKAEAFCLRAGRMSAAALTSLPVIIGEADIVIYTVPLHLEGVTRDLLRGKVVIEANYRNPCLEDLCSDGTRYVSGLEWLLWQAVSGFGIMTGKSPDETSMKALLLSKL
ncbi:MAG: hypothetical protein KBT00_07985 [Bacteroidales bacterium]|nr:hypothetical protein [Candidatus Cacconaster merdequi]